MTRIIVFLIGIAFVFSACTTHIAPYKQKKRSFKVPDYPSPPEARGGSLLSPGMRGFFEDDTASRVGDTLVVLVNEEESATRNATTKLSKKNETAYSVASGLGLMAALKEKFPSIDPGSYD